MALLFVGEAATRDALKIVDDLEVHLRFRAIDDFREAIRVLYDRLGLFPESGSLRPGLGRTVRLIPMSSYLVIYRYDMSYDAVNILRIVHNRRDLSPSLLVPPA